MEIKVESEIVGVIWGRTGNTASVRGEIKMHGVTIFVSEMPIFAPLDKFDFQNLDEDYWTKNLMRDFAMTLAKLNRPNMGF